MIHQIVAAVLSAALNQDVEQAFAQQADDAPGDQLAQRVDRFLGALVPEGFVGSVLVLKDGKTLLRQAYGLADPRRGIPLGTDSVMTTGSLTKQFTGAAVARAELDGLLSLDDVLPDFFEDVPADKAGISLRQLLGHSAGFPGALASDTDLRGTRDWLLREALQCRLDFLPGTGRSYSNVGYSLLAMILEEVTGVDYEELLLDEFFLPLEMERTGMVLADHEGAVFPVGLRGGEITPTFLDAPMLEDGPSWNLRGNGGILSTLEDMERWIRALDGEGEILPPELRARLDTPLVGSKDDGYGYGWGHLRSRRGTHMVEHDGGNQVFYADVHRYVDEGVSLCMMTSVAEWPAEQLIDAVEALVFGHPQAMPPERFEQSPEQLDVLAGTYLLENGESLRLSRAGPDLRLWASGPVGRRLLAGLEPGVDPARASLEQRLQRAAEAWVEGDELALDEVFGDGTPGSALAGRPDLARAIREHGPVRSAQVLAPGDDPTLLWVEIEHDLRSWWLAARLQNGKLRLLGLDTRAPLDATSARFIPVADGRLQSFALGAPRRVSLQITEQTMIFEHAPQSRARRRQAPTP